MKQANKTGFSSRLGFVMAAAGSAVGLGNIWRFPYLAAKYGGGIFLLVYLVLAVTFGFALMTTEIAIGRRTGKSAILAYKAINKKFSFLGYIASAVPILIFPYYCVIGGWIVKYMTVYFAGQAHAAAADDYFSTFISGTAQPIVFLAIFLFCTALVVLIGVQKGIEKVSKVMMPLLVILCVVIAVFALTIDGALAGLKYYLLPDFSKFSSATVLGALGQLFYSMSLAMGIMITYGSYMKKEDNIEKSVRQIEIFDTGIALLAGLIIIPSVVAFNGGSADGINAGPGLMFITLPQVFNAMGPIGGVVGTLFFLLVFFAAITSSISLMETVVSMVRDKFHWRRIPTTIAVTIGIIALGSLSVFGYGPLANFKILGMQMLDFFDFISNSVLMPIVAFLTCILVGHVVGTKVIADEVGLSAKFTGEKLHRVMIKWVAPILLVVILIAQVLSAFGVITI